MADHAQEQEMEIEALEAILMDEFKEIDPSESGLSTTSRCFQITLSLQRVCVGVEKVAGKLASFD